MQVSFLTVNCIGFLLMDKEILEAICFYYGWSEAIPEPVQSGLINSTWKLTVGDSQYLLQAINTRVFARPEQIDENLDRLAVYLAREAPGYLFTAPEKNREGKGLTGIGEQWYRVFKWVQGSHTVPVVHTTRQAFEAARAFGVFTSLLKNFDPSVLHCSLPGFHDLSLRYHQFEAALQDGNQTRIQQSKDLIRYLLSRKDLVKQYERFIHHREVKQRGNTP